MGNHVFPSAGLGREHPPVFFASRNGMPNPQGEIMLCYGSCVECGWWCACPEGWTWPDCPKCGNPAENLRPTRLSSFDPVLYENLPEGEPKAFMARFMLEREALEQRLGQPPYVPAKKKPLRERLLAGLVGRG